MDKTIVTASYGLCVFSLDTMKQFLKEKKIRSKKVLALLQKNRDLFLDTIKAGAWVPIPSINSGEYAISVDGFDCPFDEEWTEIFSYEGFNLDIKNGFWVSDIGTFLKFDETEYEGEGREVVSPYGTVEYFSNKEQWYKSLSGKISHTGYWYDVPDGKYSLTISGFARKEIVDHKAVNYGFRFGLKQIDDFTEYKNPREDTYDFNVEWIHTTKSATVQWLPKKESGITWPLKDEEYKNHIIIPLENNMKVYLTISFNLSDQTEEYVNKCRVKTRTWRKTETPEDFELESGKEYPIYEEIYKRDKRITKELGRIKIE